jgi:hypothetical protein
MGKLDQSSDQYLEAPVVILGSPRSGTSLLGNALAEHQSFYYAKELRLLWKYGNERKSDALKLKDARPEVISKIRRQFAANVQKSGRSRLLEKQPANSLRPEFVRAVFPDAYFIHIYRDPVETILSIRDLWLKKSHGFKAVEKANYMRRLREIRPRHLFSVSSELIRRILPLKVGGNLWGPRLPGMSQMIKDFGLLETCCLQWRFCSEITHRFCQSLPADRAMGLSLEDLTPERLVYLLEFCHVEDPSAVITYFNEKYSPSHTCHRAELADPQELEIIHNYTHLTQEWLSECRNDSI